MWLSRQRVTGEGLLAGLVGDARCRWLGAFWVGQPVRLHLGSRNPRGFWGVSVRLPLRASVLGVGCALQRGPRRPSGGQPFWGTAVEAWVPSPLQGPSEALHTLCREGRGLPRGQLTGRGGAEARTLLPACSSTPTPPPRGPCPWAVLHRVHSSPLAFPTFLTVGSARKPPSCFLGLPW